MDWFLYDNGLRHERINQYVLSTIFQFINDICLDYLNEVFQWATESNRILLNYYRKLKHLFRKRTVKTRFLFWDPQNETTCYKKFKQQHFQT